MTDKIVVLSTCGSAEDADRIAQALVESRLAACVNIVPQIRSVYRWQGAIETASEWLMIIKSSRELFDELRQTLERIHGYEVPEIVAIPMADGSPNYLNWLETELRA